MVGSGNWLKWLLAAPDCTHHSQAKGGKPLERGLRALPWVVLEWMKALRPPRVLIENVRELMKWGPLGPDNRPIKEREGEFFGQWIGEMRLLGYAVDWRVLDASEFGAPTRRRRLIIVARLDGAPQWPAPTHGPGLLPLRTAAQCIDWSIPSYSIFMTRAEVRAAGLNIKRPLAEKTMWRIAQGLRRFLFEHPNPFLIHVNHGGYEQRHHPLNEPMPTVTASRRELGLVSPILVQSGYGERPTQAARVLNLHDPLGTVVAGGGRHAMVMAFLAKHFGDPTRTDGGGGVVTGSDLREPMGTVTTRDHHGLVAASLVKLRGQCHGSGLDEPVPTITAHGNHLAEVRAFLTSYYGDDHAPGHGQDLREPLRTITTKARMGLVTVRGELHRLTDIHYRMLEADPELITAQFGEYAEGYDLSGATTKEDKTMLVGNSVPPHLVAAVVRANADADDLRRAA